MLLNLGDYIQSIAASQYYSKIDSYCDRDELAKFNFRSSKAILNGWYKLNILKHKILSPSKLLFTSIHINNQDITKENKNILDSWVENSWTNSIGCRDYKTAEYIDQLGYLAYFSSCLTTTLTREHLNLPNKITRKNIVFCDFDFFNVSKFFPISRFLQNYKVNKILKDVLKNYRQEKIIRTTHKTRLTDQKQRFNEALRLLKIYADATIVITSRIHCALPCLALGTPVILVTPHYDNLRYLGLSDLLNIITIRNNKIYENITTYHQKLINDTKFIPYASRLKEICNKYMKQNAYDISNKI